MFFFLPNEAMGIENKYFFNLALPPNAIEVHKQWHLIPIIGSSAIADVNLGSLTFSNPHARRLTLHGLVNVGQLFRTNEAGHVTAANMKTMAELQAEYDPNMTYIMMGSLAKLARHHTGYLAVATQLKSESRIKLAGVIVQQTQIFNDHLTLSGWLSDQSRKKDQQQTVALLTFIQK